MASLFLFVATQQSSAHSMKSLENQLYAKEKYVQVFNKEAPDFNLQDADGRPLGLDDLKGKVVVLHFIYTNCPDICPLHAERIAEIQEMVNRTPMRDAVQFVTITTDPKNDKGDILKEYGEAQGLDPVNWTFLTSGPDNLEMTRDLVESYGHKFIETDDGYQVHSVVTHIIDLEGNWRANFYGLKFEPTNLVLFINALVNDVHDAKGDNEDGFWQKMKSFF